MIADEASALEDLFPSMLVMGSVWEEEVTPLTPA